MADKSSKLSHEDRIIWEKVARTVTPLPGKKMVEVKEAAETMASLMGDGPVTKTQPAGLVTESQPEPRDRQPRVRAHRLHPIERPTVKKISKGRIAIDARLDLHGLKRAEAHNLLYDFLARARERGLRHVLVITGKGRSGGSEGALRREVPQWLDKPEFRLLVSGLETSSRAHGGEGALYVRLRRTGEPRS